MGTSEGMLEVCLSYMVWRWGSKTRSTKANSTITQEAGLEESAVFLSAFPGRPGQVHTSAYSTASRPQHR